MRQNQPTDVIAIGCHRQTVWHEPQGEVHIPCRIGDNNQIAAHTGITVVGVPSPGYGARRQAEPLVRLSIMRCAHPVERRMVLNIGGSLSVAAGARAAVRG